MHRPIEPAILYFGTPVVVVSTLNKDGSTNIAPMSSAWWLGWSCMLGLDSTSQTSANLNRTGECVLNLVDTQNVDGVDRLALLTGSASVPLHKQALGYRTCPDKFVASGWTPLDSETVRPHRIKECPIHLEGEVARIHRFAADDPRMSVPAIAVEVTIRKIHALHRIMDSEHDNRVDPMSWRPLLMSFRRFFGLGSELLESRLGRGAEERYAPWKRKGAAALAARVALAYSNRRHRAK